MPSCPTPSTSANHRSAVATSAVRGVRISAGPGWSPPGESGASSAPRRSISPSSSARRSSVVERSHVAAVELQQVERDQRRRDLAGELVHARRGRMQPELQRLEVHHAVRDHHDLAVHHVRGGRLAREQLHELREVAAERPVAARVDPDAVRVARHDRAEAVPLRLVPPAVAEREVLLGLREHRFRRRHALPIIHDRVTSGTYIEAVSEPSAVRIEPWAAGDLPLLEQLLGDPAMMEHLGGPETP